MAAECFLGCMGFVGALPFVRAVRAWEGVAGQLGGEYRLHEMIGSGAYGMVYTGSDAAGERVAVKVISRSRSRLREVQSEAAMMQKLSHSGIVGYRKLFVGARHMCLVMDHYGGGDLVEALQRRMRKDRTPPACDLVARLASQLTSAVLYLHRHSIVHRDIKGDNVMLDREDHMDPECRVAIGDFGTARILPASARLRSPAGTKLFWSPEFFDMDYGRKVDVWALGVVVYSLVVHRLPFRDEAEVRHRPAYMPQGVSPECRDFLKSAMQRDEARRPTARRLASHTWVRSLAAEVDADSEESGDETPAAGKSSLSDSSTVYEADGQNGDSCTTRSLYASSARQISDEGSLDEEAGAPASA